MLHSGGDSVQTSKLWAHHSFPWDGKNQTMFTPVRICVELTSQGSQVPPDTSNILLSLSLAVLTFSMSYQFLGKIMFETLKVKATFDFTEGSSQSCITVS